ncbi:MAG: FtsW/RodA/SpoVE family cell cycle protein, partial [Victivallales bacterium]|nr:FtsW/RodA/SpoVE family cell cycle protein [Victivallales bacterium]
MTQISRIIFVLLLFALAITGLFFIYSTGYIGSEYPVRPNWIRQGFFLIAGFTLAAFAAQWDNRSWSWRLAVFAGYGITVLLLLLVLVAGKEIGGARRWIVLGPFLLQPAEFAKIFTIMAASLILSGEVIKGRLMQFFAALGIVAVPVLLVMLEPSYGNAASMIPCLLVMLGATYLPAWLFRSLTVLFVAAVLLVGAG